MCFVVTQFILEQQELKLKKNSKSRKKRKQNSEEEEGTFFFVYVPFSPTYYFSKQFSHLVMVISWTGRGNKFKDVFLLSLKHVWSPSRASHYKSNISVPAE